MKSKRILSLVLAMVMVLGAFGTVFAEVAETTNDKIEWLQKQGMVQGDASGNLMLDQKIDRASTAKMIAVALGAELEAQGLKGVNSGFKDMSTGHWANGFVNYAAGKSLVKGDTKGNYMPSKDITYGEVTTILVRLVLDRDLTAAEKGTAGSWMAPYIARATEEGIFKDMPIPNFEEKAIRKDVLEMFYNAIVNMEVGRFSVVKAIVLENDRVEAIGKNEVVVEVIEHVQVAGFAGESRKTKGDQLKYTIEADVDDVENLLGKVVNFTVDKNNKVIKTTVDTSFEYLQGPITLTRNSLRLGGTTYTVELDERYAKTDERIFRTYHNDKAYAYADFFRGYTSANFAKVTVKNGKVLYIDSFTFDDIAPVQEVKREGTEVYVYNDLRDGEIKRLGFNAGVTKVISVDNKVFSRANVENIGALDVVHTYGVNKVLVRKDTKVDGKYTRVRENASGHFVEINEKDYHISDVNSQKAVYSYNSKQFYTLYPNNAAKLLSEFKDLNVTVLLDVNGNVQFFGSEFELGEYVAGVVSIVGKDARVIRHNNVKEDLVANLDTVIKLDNTTTSHQRLQELDRQDIIYVAANDRDINRIHLLQKEANVKAGKNPVDMVDASYVVNRNILRVLLAPATATNPKVTRDYKVLDRTNVFYYTRDTVNANGVVTAKGTVVGSTIDDIMKNHNSTKDLTAYVITDADYEAAVGSYGKRVTSKSPDVANTIIFTDVTMKTETAKEIVKVLGVRAIGNNYEIQYENLAGDVIYKTVEAGSVAHNDLRIRDLNNSKNSKNDLVGSVVKITVNDNDVREILSYEVMIYSNSKAIYEFVRTEVNAGQRRVTLKDSRGIEETLWVSRDAAEFGYTALNGSKLSFSFDVNYQEITSILGRPSNATLGTWDGLPLSNVLQDVIELPNRVLIKVDGKLYEYAANASNLAAARALIGKEVAFDIYTVNEVEYALNLRASVLNKALLNAKLVEIAALKEVEYTEASWLAFNEALVLANALPEVTQVEVNDKVVALQAALDKLAKKPAPGKDVTLAEFTDAVDVAVAGAFSVAVVKAEMVEAFPTATDATVFVITLSNGLTYELVLSSGYFANWDVQGAGVTEAMLNAAVVTVK